MDESLGAAEESPSNGSHKELLGNGFHKGEDETLEELGSDENDNGQVKDSGFGAGAEENGQSLAAKLKIALKEIVTKDNLVKQHAKVAEDAISGWEKAESEAAALKQQLENTLQQKLALEERTAHLDGALKECVKQLRTAREEQEQVREEMGKRSEEWETLQAELEKKLSKAEAAASENATNADALEQRIHSLTDAKTQAELEAKKVSSKVEALEKENLNLKHDVRSLKKDLVHLNNESKKASESSKVQLSESARKVSRLEAECQKLKTQLRKRSTGSKVEGETLERRKSLSRLVSSPRAFSVDMGDDCSEMSTREMDEKWLSLEDEVKMLKEEMVKKNKELEAARVLCSRAASRLSTMEEQGLSSSRYIENLKAFGSNQKFSLGSHSDGEEGDAWASPLADELALLKEDKKPDKLLDTTSFELMDDFLEMEKLTSNLPQENGLPAVNKNGVTKSVDLARKEEELEAANERIDLLSRKLASLEDASGEARGSKLESSLINKIIGTIELLAVNIGLKHEGDRTSSEDPLIEPRLVWEDSSINGGFERLAACGSLILQGKTELVSFAEQVARVLEEVAACQPGGDALQLEKKEREVLQEQLSGSEATVAYLRSEKLALENAHRERASEVEMVRVQNRELEEQVAEKVEIIEQLRSSIAALEEDVSAAEERAHSTVRGLSATFEEDLEREKLERERSVEAMNVVMAELQAQKSSLDENAKSLVKKLAALEEELKRERLEKLAAKKDIEAVNQDLQKLMGEFFQLQHEKQGLETALGDAKLGSEAAHGVELARLQESLTRSLHLEEQSRALADGVKVELEMFAQREEALQKSISERDTKQIETLVRVEKMKEEKAQLVARVDDLEQKLGGVAELLRAEQGRVSALKEENEGLELRSVALEGRVSNREEKLQEMEVSFRSLQDEFYQAKIEKEEMEQSFFSAEQEARRLQAKVSSLEEECGKLREKHLEFDRSDRELRAVSTGKDRELEELKLAAHDSEAECRLREAELSSLRATYEELELRNSELETEKRDLEHVLSATNEIVQGLKEECSRLSEAEVRLSGEKQRLEKELGGAEEKLRAISQELKALEGEKAELEHDLALSQVTWKSQVFEADELVASLRAELALAGKSKQLAEEQLAESFNSKAELQYQVKAAVHEAGQLSERTKSLEGELQSERVKVEASAAEINELRLQLSRVEVSENEEVVHQRGVEVSDVKSLELSAKLDECHRAILTLGEQLQALSASRSSNPPSPTPEAPSSSSEESIMSTPKAEEKQHDQQQHQREDVGGGGENDEGLMEGKVFVPSLPLEGRPRAKSTSPGKPKISKSSSASKELDFSKSVDLSSSPSEKPSSSSGFSRFFRGKSSHH